jgi:hypothetical protein
MKVKIKDIIRKRILNFIGGASPNMVKRQPHSINFPLGNFKFAEVIFENITEILIDLQSDTSLIFQGGNEISFDIINLFFKKEGKKFLYYTYRYGRVFLKETRGDYDYFFSKKNKAKRVIVFDSEHYQMYGKSHFDKLFPFFDLLNNILNASNTITKRLGVAVFATPVTPGSSSFTGNLTPEQKRKIETELENTYGALESQNILHILTEDLKFNQINLAGQNINLTERSKIAILTIADKIKVPANQISLIDASTSKAFANGSEILAGDFQKYQSFERLLVSTFYPLAEILGCAITYDIYNKPLMPNNNNNNIINNNE